MPGFHVAEPRTTAMIAANRTKLIRPRSRSGSGRGGACGVEFQAKQQEVDDQENRQHRHGDNRGLQPEIPQRPQEIHAMQKADKQRRIAERAQRAADIAGEQNEKDHHMDIVAAPFVGADQRANEDERRAGGAEEARHDGAERDDAEIGPRAGANASGNQDAAGDRVEREQQKDEADIVGEHHIKHCRERDRRAAQHRQRHDRQHRPGQHDLAVMGVPDFRQQQRAERDRQQDAGERQRPRPRQRCAMKR